MKRSFFIWALLISCSLAAQKNPKLAFGDQQRKGANGDGGALQDSGTSPEQWFNAASEAGIEYVRLAVAEWTGKKADFLMGDADQFDVLVPEDLAQLIRVLDVYGAWEYATYRVNKGRFIYPEKMPSSSGGIEGWQDGRIEAEMAPIFAWMERYKVPLKRIVAAEFGVDRRVGGAREFLKDMIAFLNKKQLHWAFYSFRSATWDGMDYELGSEKLKWGYWKGREAGQSHEELINRRDNPLWEIFKREFAPKEW